MVTKLLSITMDTSAQPFVYIKNQYVLQFYPFTLDPKLEDFQLREYRKDTFHQRRVKKGQQLQYQFYSSLKICPKKSPNEKQSAFFSYPKIIHKTHWTSNTCNYNFWFQHNDLKIQNTMKKLQSSFYQNHQFSFQNLYFFFKLLCSMTGYTNLFNQSIKNSPE